jgi:hypothetical protein
MKTCMFANAYLSSSLLKQSEEWKLVQLGMSFGPPSMLSFSCLCIVIMMECSLCGSVSQQIKQTCNILSLQHFNTPHQSNSFVAAFQRSCTGAAPISVAKSADSLNWLAWWLFANDRTCIAQIKCVMDKDYIPNFQTAFDHFLVHTGGRAVIEEVEKKLRLNPNHVQPSKETLFRYGNTCCAAVFYVLTNMESRVSPQCCSCAHSRARSGNLIT